LTNETKEYLIDLLKIRRDCLEDWVTESCTDDEDEAQKIDEEMELIEKALGELE
jgi:hypothetical protein